MLRMFVRDFAGYFKPLLLLIILTMLISARWGHAQDETPATPPAIESTATAPMTVQETRRHTIDSPANCANSSYRLAATLENDNGATFVTAPNPDGAVVVDLGLYLEELNAIDEASGTYNMEGFLDMVWCDPRLAFDAAEEGVAEKLYLESDAQQLLSSIWSPDIEFVNADSPRSSEDMEIIVQPDGTVEYEERFSVELKARYDLVRFPFDSQHLEVEVESFAWDTDYLLFHSAASTMTFSSEFELSEWRVVGVESSVTSRQEERDREPFSEFLLTITVERRWEFYMWKLMVPFFLLVVLSWTVFWMSEDNLGKRMGVSSGGILTVIAYQFAITGNLPRVAYFTYIDAVLAFSFIMTTAAAAQNMVFHHLQTSQQAERATRLDERCRWLFPLVYVAGLALISVLYLR